MLFYRKEFDNQEKFFYIKLRLNTPHFQPYFKASNIHLSISHTFPSFILFISFEIYSEFFKLIILANNQKLTHQIFSSVIQSSILSQRSLLLSKILVRADCEPSNLKSFKLSEFIHLTI
jgi:hypothetical protein